MARGIKLPVGVDSRGGTAWVQGNDENDKIIFSALTDCENENAFQQSLGIGADIVFDVNDEGAQAKALGRITAIFDKFEAEHRFKLRTDTLRWTRDSEKGELILEFMYHDMESDEEKPFARVFRKRTT